MISFRGSLGQQPQLPTKLKRQWIMPLSNLDYIANTLSNRIAEVVKGDQACISKSVN